MVDDINTMEDNKPKGFSSWDSGPEAESDHQEFELELETEVEIEIEIKPEPEPEIVALVEEEPAAEEKETKPVRHHHRNPRPLVNLKPAPKRGEFAAKIVRP
jgi:hypothetical protein